MEGELAMSTEIFGLCNYIMYTHVCVRKGGEDEESNKGKEDGRKP
jgi:hypothetical protein